MTHVHTEDNLHQMLAAGISPAEVAEQLGLDYDAATDSVVTAGWMADDGNGEAEYARASSAPEAAQQYVDGGDCCADEESIAIPVYCWRRGWTAEGEEVEVSPSDEIVVVHPEEPACDASSSSSHEWSDDHELVGGDARTPGTWAAGGCSIRWRSVCTCCGMARTETSASQGEDTEHDHETVRYSAGAVTAAELASYHRGDVPDAVDVDSDDGSLLARACAAYRERGDTGH